MNLIQQATILSKRNKTMLTRQDRIKREGSEYYSYVLPVTIAAAISGFEIASQFPAARKYQPLDFIEVCNNDAVNLTLIINGNMQLPVPAGTIRTVDNSSIWEVAIRNDDAAVATTLGLVIVTLRRQPMTIDQWARRGA